MTKGDIRLSLLLGSLCLMLYARRSWVAHWNDADFIFVLCGYGAPLTSSSRVSSSDSSSMSGRSSAGAPQPPITENALPSAMQQSARAAR